MNVLSHIRLSISQGVSLVSLEVESGTASPGCAPLGAAELVCREWSEVRALSGKECLSTFHKLNKELGLEVGWVEFWLRLEAPRVCPGVRRGSLNTLLVAMGTMEGSWWVLTPGRRWAHMLILF